MEEFQHRIGHGQPFAIGYADLDQFKIYNDKYGFEKGDEIIRATARILINAVRGVGGEETFIGHIGGDDFVFICSDDKADAISQSIIDGFDKLSPTFYNEEDRAAGFITGTHLKFRDEPFDVVVKQYYPNAQAYSVSGEGKFAAVKNDSGIALLQPKEVLKEREKNVAGGIFEVNIQGRDNVDVLLYGSDLKATSIMTGKRNYFFRLQHKKFHLPLTIELLDFRVQFHPGTQTAKSYESTVRITHDGASREAVISMNKPLRYKDYTFFQASYAIDSFGREYSTFAVVKNFGRFLPYVASLLTFTGLALHFLMMAFAARPKKRAP